MLRNELEILNEDLKNQAKNRDIEEVVKYFYPELTFPPRGRLVNGYEGREKTSRVIDREKNIFFWNSLSGSYAYDTIAVCTKLQGMSYSEALGFLTGRDMDTERKAIFDRCRQYEPESPKKFQMPEKNIYNGRYNTYYASEYLKKERAIPDYIVSSCMSGEKPLIMQDNRSNCVFIGYNDEGEAKYAAKRGTRPYIDKNTGEVTSFKRDAVGSDKSFAFKLVGSNTSTVYVTEAAIDALSLAALEDMFALSADGNGTGRKNAYREKTYLSTGGAGIDNALEQFCNTHNVKVINVCFDNDTAGHNGMMKIKEKYEAKGYIVNDMCSTLAHDYNDLLVAIRNNSSLYNHLKQNPLPVITATDHEYLEEFPFGTDDLNLIGLSISGGTIQLTGRGEYNTSVSIPTLQKMWEGDKETIEQFILDKCDEKTSNLREYIYQQEKRKELWEKLPENDKKEFEKVHKAICKYHEMYTEGKIILNDKQRAGVTLLLEQSEIPARIAEAESMISHINEIKEKVLVQQAERMKQQKRIKSDCERD